MRWRPPVSTLFPYTTLFRSRVDGTGLPFEHLRPGIMRRLAASARAREAFSTLCHPGYGLPNFWSAAVGGNLVGMLDRKSTRLNSSHTVISYAVFCLKKKRNK